MSSRISTDVAFKGPHGSKTHTRTAIWAVGGIVTLILTLPMSVQAQQDPTQFFIRCAGGINTLGGGAEAFHFRIVEGQLPGSFGPVTGPSPSFVGCEVINTLVDCEIDCNETPFNETGFGCDDIIAEIASQIDACINDQAPGIFTFEAITGVANAYQLANNTTTPTYLGICSPEISLSCDDQICHPLNFLPIFNLCDGLRGNETEFDDIDQGVGFEVIPPPIPTPTSMAPTPTGTLPTPTSTSAAPTPTGTLPTSTPTNIVPTQTGTLPTATITQTPVVSNTPTITNTPTASFTPGCDAGYYLLQSGGGLQRVGNIINITGGPNFGSDFAQDLERASLTVKGPGAGEDLVVLDGSGILHFAENPGNTIDQDFMFPTTGTFPEGRAVDFQLTQDSQGAWVLTDFGGIYRAGSAKDASEPSLVLGTGQMGVYGYDVSFGLFRAGGLANPGGASLRAVGLVVFDIVSPTNRAEGYLLLDSQGGRRQLNADGSDVAPGTYSGLSADHPHFLLEPAPSGLVYPFFPGLDIARDVDLLVTGDEGNIEGGVVIYDGWGGIHPVPVDRISNPVYFARNDDPNDPGTPITTVGMPYLTVGFDDPETPADESDETAFGFDAFSVFVDFDFSAGCDDAFYTLDRFGAIFAFGGGRPTPDTVIPNFGVPNPLDSNGNARDMELFAADEVEFVVNEGR